MKVMESITNGIRKEIHKEVRKKLRILPDDLKNFFLSFPLSGSYTLIVASLVMGPQASCLFLHLAYHIVLTLLFLAPKPTMAPQCTQSSLAPQPHH